ncbi:hypothetical protein PF010_g14479 [Phytophthora fragariae]|uniref:DDE Tnp4 domain-containing protein n=1 Tax=Phytophthora fragariae TaxID=53985 RepID=A0A6A3M433_9STRA|nr:hypothetical protein PF011_g4158 [Phytophthora fragariae]KAE9101359.1 hypothetical protein PF010_g14479 [Phytophthora fragariae]
MDDEDTLALVQTVQEEEIATIILFELVLSAPLSYRDRLLVPDFRLDILAMPDQEAKDQFRFIICNLQNLVEHLKILDPVITKEGVRATALEALAICLRRMVYPQRWIDMAAMFGRAPSTLCQIFYFVVEHLDKTFADLLYFDSDRITKNLDRYCREIAAKTPNYIEGVWGFIDGTVRPICRPGVGQQAVYNGHKRVHAFKFQTVVAPDGIICHAYGPVDGRRHDIYMLRESGLMSLLEGSRAFHNKLIYGDPAYGCTNVFCCPFKGCRIDAPRQTVNKAMSKVRVSVEWSYGEITRYFSYLDFKRQQQVVTTPVATLYKLGILFTNCITIARGRNNSKYFNCPSPTFDEYFSSTA